MRLSKFKTEYSFGKWFSKNREKFGFTSINLRGVDEPYEIARLTDKNKTVGLVVYNQWDKDEMYIALFEIQEKYRGRGYGREMFDMLIKEENPKWVLLDFCYGDGGDSLKFWRKMGFHRRLKYTISDTEMRKTIRKKHKKQEE